MYTRLNYPAYPDAHLRFISSNIDLVKDAHAFGQLAVIMNISSCSDFFLFFHWNIDHTNLLFLNIHPYLSRPTTANAKTYKYIFKTFLPRGQLGLQVHSPSKMVTKNLTTRCPNQNNIWNKHQRQITQVLSNTITALPSRQRASRR